MKDNIIIKEETVKVKVKKLEIEYKENIDVVVENYGKISAWSLVELTHGEDPWNMTNRDEVIENEMIKRYFKKVYN